MWGGRTCLWFEYISDTYQGAPALCLEAVANRTPPARYPPLCLFQIDLYDVEAFWLPIPTGKDTFTFFCFRTWITNWIHIRIRDKFWAQSSLNSIHIPRALRRNLSCDSPEHTNVKKHLGYWIWIQYEYIYVKQSPGIRNVFIPVRMAHTHTHTHRTQ